MIEKFLIAPDPSERTPVTTIRGLKKEVYTSVLRYFAPVVAIYEQFERTAGISPAWQRRKLDEDRAARHG